MGVFEYSNLRDKVIGIDKFNNDKGNTIASVEFDIFIDHRVIKGKGDDEFEVRPHITDELHMADDHIMTVNLSNSPDMGMDNNFNENIDLNSEVNYSMDAISNVIESDGHMLDQTPNRYDMNSSVSSFQPSNDGIFQESSFLLMEDDKGLSEHSYKTEIDFRKTMIKIKKMGDGSKLYDEKDDTQGILNP
jgi:hypothetical protein